MEPILYDRHPQANDGIPVSHLYRIFLGKRAWILASGKTMDFIPKELLEPVDLTIGVNEVWRQYPCAYVLSHHGEHLQEAVDAGKSVVTSEWQCGIPEWGPTR